MQEKVRYIVLLLAVVSLAWVLMQLIKKIGTDDVCSTLGEQDCIKNSACYPSYIQEGPNTDKVGMPLLNYSFDGCLRLTQEEILKIRKEKASCVENKGTWYTTYGNPKGFCSL